MGCRGGDQFQPAVLLQPSEGADQIAVIVLQVAAAELLKLLQIELSQSQGTRVWVLALCLLLSQSDEFLKMPLAVQAANSVPSIAAR